MRELSQLANVSFGPLTNCKVTSNTWSHLSVRNIISRVGQRKIHISLNLPQRTTTDGRRPSVYLLVIRIITLWVCA